MRPNTPLLLLLMPLMSMSTSQTIADRPASPTKSDAEFSDQCHLKLDSETIQAYESLDKWKGCTRTDAPVRLVYQHNRSRAAATGFPTRLSTGKNLGLTDHETAAVFGWTTGDYRLINPTARGSRVVEFDEYPFLPSEMTPVKCRLNREDVLPYVAVLNSALSKLPELSNKQRLWRGHRRTIYPSKVGSIVHMEGFTSVTRDRENALQFAAKLNEGRSKKRTLIGILEHSSAKCVSKLSARPGEMEVLFPPNKTFEVVAPPGDTADDDLMAVQRSAERMRKSDEGVEIELVYVREVIDKYLYPSMRME